MPALARRLRTPFSPGDDHHPHQEPLDHLPPPHHLQHPGEPDGMSSPPLQPGMRKLKKQDKDKLKNRMSLAFRKPFLTKDKNKSPEVAYSPPPVAGPPAYSYAVPPSLNGSAPSKDGGGLNSRRRSSGGGSQSKPGRSNKPIPHPSEGMVPRRSHVGSGAVGTSPPLPPLPRNGSIEGPADPRVTALLGGGANLQLNDLLPHNSFGPAFDVPTTLEGLGSGLGIGIEQSPPARMAVSPPPARQPTPPSLARSPPPALNQPQIRLHTPPPREQPTPPPQQQHQLHHQHSHPQLRTEYQQQPPPPHQGMPALARPVTAPEQPQQTYLTRRLSMIAAGQSESAASKRLSMMRRGPPVFTDSSANSSTTTLETAAANAAQTMERLSHSRPTSPPMQPPAPVEVAQPLVQEPEVLPPQKPSARLLDEDEVGELSSASRDRIAKLRTARSSVSGPSPSAGPLNALALAGRGANRRDPTKAYTLAAAPQGFDVSLIKSGKSTFTPLKPLPSPASSIARPSPLNPATAPVKPTPSPAPAPAPAKVAAVPPPPPPAASKDMYVLRPTVTMSTQTPNWDDFRSPRQAAAYGQSSMSTPPLAYASFPGPPPPPPPHDSPPMNQRSNISPSIYSVASFDARSRNLRAGGRAGRSSFYASGEDPNEEDEYEYEDQPPLPDESARAIERHSMAFGNGYGDEHDYADEEERLEDEDVAPTPVNYDIPYLQADPYDTPHLRPYEIPATPLAVPHHRSDPSLVAASPALTDSVNATPRVDDSPPSVTPMAYAAPTFTTSHPFHSTETPAIETLEVPESPRSNSRSRSPSPAPSRERNDSFDSSVASSISAIDSALSDRRTSSELHSPPTSAVSSMFPQHESAVGSDGEADSAPVVMIRKASIVTSQVRKASLVSVTPPSSRPQSVVLRKGSLASLSGDKRLSMASSDGGASSSGSPSVGRESPRGRSPKQLQFHLDLPDGEEIPPIPAVPSPIRREYGDAAFPFPLGGSPVSPPAVSPEAEKEKDESEAAPTPRALSPPQPAADSPAVVPEASIAIQSPSPSPARAPSPAPSAPHGADAGTAPLLAPVDFDAVRPASAPPADLSSLPFRCHSEADKPIPRARTPGGMMSREERAAKGRSYFLVQALMGEAQPEGMIRDWAKAEGESDDDDVSILAGESSSEDELGDFEDEEQ
ncbi:hypothetical protein JCM8097_006886 [Rhodosporidiobolus ruineniae]